MTDPAALTINTGRGPKATRVHSGPAQRPAIMARAKAAIILDAPFCSYPRSVVKNVTVQLQTEKFRADIEKDQEHQEP